MEILREIVGDDAHTDDVLCCALVMHDDDVGRAADYLLDRANFVGEDRPTSASIPTLALPALASNPLNVVFEASTESRGVSAPDQAILPAEPLAYFPDIDNGDCVFYCLCQVLNHLSSTPLTTMSRKTIAGHMRAYVNAFIEHQWSHWSKISSMSWCDLITFSHNTAVTADEQETFGVWGETDAERLSAWLNERDAMYGGIAEITAFVEMLSDCRVDLVVRIWRKVDQNLVLSTSIAMPQHMGRPHVADFCHSGEMDTNTAHMRLISNNSFLYTPRRVFGRRSAKDDDPDYEPCTKKKRKQGRGRPSCD